MARIIESDVDGVLQITATDRGAAILPDGDLQPLLEAVLSGKIVIVKEAFDPAELTAQRRAMSAWRAETPEQSLDRTAAGVSRHRRDVNPEKSQTKHIFDAYLFELGEKRDNGIESEVRATFDAIGQLWCRLTGTEAGMEPDATGRALRPQAIHYPSGGGWFDWHEHNLEPQKVGLILCLSERDRNFRTGGTQFKIDGELVDSTAVHDIGDICLFRYDLPHAVSPVDANDDLTWDCDLGRWTMVLPLI